ncbi:hypothetical protein ACJX0J_022044, partial [Zea mays]
FGTILHVFSSDTILLSCTLGPLQEAIRSIQQEGLERIFFCENKLYIKRVILDVIYLINLVEVIGMKFVRKKLKTVELARLPTIKYQMSYFVAISPAPLLNLLFGEIGSICMFIGALGHLIYG